MSGNPPDDRSKMPRQFVPSFPRPGDVHFEAGVRVPSVENPSVPGGWQHLGPFGTEEEARLATQHYGLGMGTGGGAVSAASHVTRVSHELNPNTGLVEAVRTAMPIHEIMAVGDYPRGDHQVTSSEYSGALKKGGRTVIMNPTNPFAQHDNDEAWRKADEAKKARQESDRASEARARELRNRPRDPQDNR